MFVVDYSGHFVKFYCSIVILLSVSVCVFFFSILVLECLSLYHLLMDR